MFDELKKVMLAGVGGAALTAEKADELINRMVAKGQLTVDEGKKLSEELIQRKQKPSNDMMMREELEAHLIEISAAHRKDIDELEKQVEELNRKVEELQGK